MMFDLVIRGGTLVDGNGAPPRTADVAIADGMIVEVGRVGGSARREIDADGLYVSPGWVDIHTHYDGQATWDNRLDPSFSSGVTTAIIGNCGVGFAPVADGMQERLIELMEGVEEIPGTALHIGMRWNWRTFPEYLDALDAMPRSFDVGALMPHGPLRLWAMGDKAGSDKSASGEELRRMEGELAAGLRAGAFGLATSRTPLHRTMKGEMTPDFDVDLPELAALAAVVKAHGGYLQVVPEGIAGESPDGLREEMALLRHIVEMTGVDLHLLLFQTASDPDYHREQLALIDDLNGRCRATAQFGGRCTGAIMSFLGANPFMGCPTYETITRLPLDQWLPELARPEVKARILSERNPPGSPGELFSSALDRIFDLGDDLDFEPPPERLVCHLAAREGRDPREFTYELILRHSDPPRIYLPFTNYADGDLEPVREALMRPSTVLSASDAGAHVLTVCDGSINSFMLTHWVRDRRRGPRIPIEEVVRLMTSKPALSVGLGDRGIVAPGYKADLNIFDLANLRLHHPTFRNDLPGGARRLMQDVTGYRATIVSGEVTREYDESTGALPGRLLRRGRRG